MSSFSPRIAAKRGYHLRSAPDDVGQCDWGKMRAKRIRRERAGSRRIVDERQGDAVLPGLVSVVQFTGKKNRFRLLKPYFFRIAETLPLARTSARPWV